MNITPEQITAISINQFIRMATVRLAQVIKAKENNTFFFDDIDERTGEPNNMPWVTIYDNLTNKTISTQVKKIFITDNNRIFFTATNGNTYKLNELGYDKLIIIQQALYEDEISKGN